MRRKEIVTKKVKNIIFFRNPLAIEINSIEELVILSRKYGEIIIADHYLDINDVYPTLEIYDDYRE